MNNEHSLSSSSSLIFLDRLAKICRLIIADPRVVTRTLRHSYIIRLTRDFDAPTYARRIRENAFCMRCTAAMFDVPKNNNGVIVYYRYRFIIYTLYGFGGRNKAHVTRWGILRVLQVVYERFWRTLTRSCPMIRLAVRPGVKVSGANLRDFRKRNPFCFD